MIVLMFDISELLKSCNAMNKIVDKNVEVCL